MNAASGAGGSSPAAGWWTAAPWLVLLAAVLAGAPGLATLPPDEHEVLVLQTAREMHARGDWLVPYFNGEPRLNKPPLSYWATAVVAAAAGTLGEIAPWHGRLPSFLAGLAAVGLVLWAGHRLHGPRVAALGAGLLASSAGYFTYTHDARPDMLYAGLCWAGLALFALALAGVHPLGSARARGTALAGWALFALATLAKGPQVPAMLLVALGVAAQFEERGARAAWARLEPLRGALVFGALVAPWWLCLDARLPPEAVAGSQLGGSLLRPDFASLFNGYYLYRPLQLALPWVPLVPLAWLALGRLPGRPAVRLWLSVLAVTVLAFSFGSQQRYFYLLPVLPVMCLLTAAGMERLLNGGSGGWLRGALWVQVGVVGAALGWLCADHGRWLTGGALLGGGLLAVLIARRAGGTRLSAATAAAMLATAAAFGLFAESERFWSADRLNKQALATAVAARAPAGGPLVAFRLTPAVYVWTANRAIPRVNDPAALARLTDGGPVWTLMPVEEVASLPARLSAAPLVLMPAGADDRAGLYRIEKLD